jgi:hypothetical protein
MLYRPEAKDRLHEIEVRLAGWAEDADRFRRAAIAARRGTPQSVTLADAAEEVRDELMSLVDDLDLALDRLPPGHAEFGAVLAVQGAALALLESVGNSLDVFAEMMPEERTAATPIARAPSPNTQ